MPTARVPPVSTVAAKWARRAASAGPEYEMGVTGAGGRWQAAAAAAEGNYKTAVTTAASAGRFGRGVAKAGGAKYERGATTKGPARFAQGVGVAEGDYSSQVAPYLQAIASVDLPPRQPAGSEGNMQRVAAIARALRALKVGR